MKSQIRASANLSLFLAQIIFNIDKSKLNSPKSYNIGSSLDKVLQQCSLTPRQTCKISFYIGYFSKVHSLKIQGLHSLRWHRLYVNVILDNIFISRVLFPNCSLKWMGAKSPFIPLNCTYS